MGPDAAPRVSGGAGMIPRDGRLTPLSLSEGDAKPGLGLVSSRKWHHAGVLGATVSVSCLMTYGV